jgi:hypothetical protein
MLKGLKALLGLAGREDATSDELAPSLPEAEAELAAALAAQADAEAAYRAALIKGNEAEEDQADAERQAIDKRIVRAKILIETLRECLAEAQERELEAERVERYEAARRQGDEAGDALRVLYPQFAGGIVELLRAVAEAEIAVKAANGDLPRGAAPLAGVENRVRNFPGFPDEVLSETHVERWVRIGQILPGNFDQGEVRPTEGNRGTLRVRGLPANEGYGVELRQFIQRELFPATFSGGTDSLALGVSLPGFMEGEPKLFEPIERPYQGGLHPAHVLEKIAGLRAVAPRGDPANPPQPTPIIQDGDQTGVAPAAAPLKRNTYGSFGGQSRDVPFGSRESFLIRLSGAPA